jgi:Zn-dependent peptidase ImmA (M78 family)
MVPSECPSALVPLTRVRQIEEVDGVAAKTEVPITGTVLAWAMDEAGVDDATLAKRTKVNVTDVQAWKAGTARPGRTEFKQILATVRRPSAIFFMPSPPVSQAMPTRFRYAPGLRDHKLTPTALREIRRARRLQRAVGWVYASNNVSVVDLPRYDWEATDPAQAGSEVRQTFMLSVEEQARWRDIPEALRNWRAMLDERGILIFSLTLGREEVRGFSAWDDYAPLIALNTTEYSEAARIYTLAHEFGHLVSRTDSACFDWLSPAGSQDPKIERWCEGFAAAFLLPPVQLKGYLAYRYSINPANQVTDFQTVWDLSRRLKVSARALAISLRDAGLAPAFLYDLVDEQAIQVDRPRRRSAGGAGERNPEKRLRTYGVRAPRALVDAVAAGSLAPDNAADFLELNLSDLKDLGSLLTDERAVGA